VYPGSTEYTELGFLPVEGGSSDPAPAWVKP